MRIHYQKIRILLCHFFIILITQFHDNLSAYLPKYCLVKKKEKKNPMSLTVGSFKWRVQTFELVPVLLLLVQAYCLEVFIKPDNLDLFLACCGVIKKLQLFWTSIFLMLISKNMSYTH